MGNNDPIKYMETVICNNWQKFIKDAMYVAEKTISDKWRKSDNFTEKC